MVLCPFIMGHLQQAAVGRVGFGESLLKPFNLGQGASMVMAPAIVAVVNHD